MSSLVLPALGVVALIALGFILNASKFLRAAREEVASGQVTAEQVEREFPAACRRAAWTWLILGVLRLVATVGFAIYLFVAGPHGVGGWEALLLTCDLVVGLGLLGTGLWALGGSPVAIIAGIFVAMVNFLVAMSAALPATSGAPFGVGLVIVGTACLLPGLALALGITAGKVACQRIAVREATAASTLRAAAASPSVAPGGDVLLFHCPACGKKIRTAANRAGKRVRCPRAECGQVVTAPPA
jgi:predicted RNA-binding Zn-ribbon protein involved in translation (DUF1610 family)